MQKKALKRIFLGFIALYFVIFAVRAVYDLITFQDTDVANNYNIYYTGEKEDMRSVKNYASQKMEYSEGQSATVLDQKYERIASITSKTVNYENDLGHFKATLEENRAVVQMENSRGLPGSRRVDLVIGVRPENFDAMQAAVLQIGRVTSSTTTKTDKTYEYRQMLAEKATLERRLASYAELKERGGSISEMLQLEDKIIEVEAQIQQQLIGLGEYSDENALCTINFSLYEGSEAGVTRKLWNALKWSTITYVIIIAILLFAAFAAFVLAGVWNYLKKTLVDKPEAAQPDITEQTGLIGKIDKAEKKD